MKMQAIVSDTIELIVPFHDLDMMSVCWHGNYVKYFEIGRCALLKKIDYDYLQMIESGYLWPIVDLQIRYIKPLRYDQRMIVESSLLEYENRLRIKYLVTDAKSCERLTKGYTTQVAVEKETLELQLISPAILKEKLAHFL